MKKMLILAVTCMSLLFVQTNASIPSSVSNLVKDSVSTIDETTLMSKELMLRVSKMSVKEYETLTGKKMNLFQRIAFKAYKKKLAKRAVAAYDDETEGFNLGGFTAGLIFGGLGVLLVYIFSGDRNKRKWAWIGWGSWLVILLTILLLT